MASRVSEPSARNDIELGPVTHWPTVYAAIGVGAAVLLGVTVVAVLAALQPAPAPTPEAVAAVAPAPPARARGVTVKAEPPAAPVAAEVVSAPEPSPAESPPPPPPAPVRVATAVTPLIRVADPMPAPEQAAAPPPIVPPPQFALFDDLQRNVHEIDLGAVKDTTAALRIRPGDNRAKREGAEKVTDLITRRPDLAGLPVRGETECKTPTNAAQGIELLSRDLRRLQGGLLPSEAPLHYDRTYAIDLEVFCGERGMPPERNRTILQFLDGNKRLLQEENASTLAQMLQTEDMPVRLQLTKILASIKGRPAGQALARQALFDLTPEVREAATAALKDRPAEDYRQTLLDGFRHPWPPVADHAAEALAALQDRAAVPNLEKMQDMPDPSAPELNEQKRWVKAELVKVNHLRNCLLCHALSTSAKDLVRAPIPKPGEPLPEVYYERIRGEAIHADVTYLRQDFSLVEAVKDHDEWPLGQRFDYLVRRRPLTDQEVIDMADCGDEPSSSYPQREAVLRALETLTRSDNARPIEMVGLGP